MFVTKKKFSKEIADLRDSCRNLKLEVARLRFMIDNPSKYKKGDRIKDWIVNFVELPILYFEWQYTLVNTKTGDSKVFSEGSIKSVIEKKKR